LAQPTVIAPEPSPSPLPLIAGDRGSPMPAAGRPCAGPSGWGWGRPP